MPSQHGIHDWLEEQKQAVAFPWLKGQTLISELLKSAGYHTGLVGKFEWCARIPFLMAGPGVTKGGVVERTTEHLDIYPTLVALCGLQNAPRLHGTSLTGLLQDPDGARWDKPAVTQARRPARQVDGYSIRTERYRYTLWMGKTEGEELYDYERRIRER